MNARRTRTTIAALVAASLVAAAPAGRAQKPPSAADLLSGYVEWVHGTRENVPTVAVDLDAARANLARLAPVFLIPVQGLVTNLRGTCPSVTFTVSGTTVATGSSTTFDAGACGQIANFATVSVVRQADAARPAARVAVTLAGALTAQSAEQVAQAAAPRSRAQTPDERQRQLLTTFALELAASGAKTQTAAATRLVEWACAYVRAHTPINDFDRAWELAALAVIEGGIDARALAAHLAHAEAFLEPRQILARGIVEEQATAPAETRLVQAGPADSQRAELIAARPANEREHAADRAIAQFHIAAQDDVVRVEAQLRLGHVQLSVGRYDDALASLAGLDRATTDRSLVYLVHLFRGLALEGRGRSGEARAAYSQALVVSPSAHAATMRLAALMFLDGHAVEADGLLTSLLQEDDPQRDSWWSSYAGDWRFWYPRIDRVRAIVRAGHDAGQKGAR